MEHLVEGDWKQFTFKMIGPADFPALSQHLRNSFYIDEPMYKIVGSSEAQAQDLDTFIAAILNQNDNLSFVAIDRETDKIAGACINYRSRKGQTISSYLISNSRERAILLKFAIGTVQATDIFEKYGVEEYANQYIASVDKAYRNQGLCSEMYRRTFDMMRALKFPLVEGFFSSPYTRQFARKNGFEELGRRYYREIQDLNGQFLCPDAGDDEYFVLMVLKL